MTVGLVGLGQMGSALAASLVEAGLDLIAHDRAGPARCPEGVGFVPDAGAMARRAHIVVLSLPDGSASLEVAGQMAGAADRRVTHVVDTSTIGLDAARRIDALLTDAGVAYIDAPVSGGPAGARARTLTVMYAGDPDACRAVEPVLAGLGDRRFRVGPTAGMGQAMKLANNFLSATALAATSEAIAFGTSAGLSMDVMLEVLNASSGRSAATSDKFVQHVLTRRYASGFTNTLMSKDLTLYLRATRDRGSPGVVGDVVGQLWERFASHQPGADFTRIYPFVDS